jgi:hypothetical protein
LFIQTDISQNEFVLLENVLNAEEQVLNTGKVERQEVQLRPLQTRLLTHSAKFEKFVMCTFDFYPMAMSMSVFCKSEASTIFTMPQLNELQKSIIKTRL